MANGSFGGGDGSLNNPYIVDDVHDFDAIRYTPFNSTVYYKQSQDIDFSSFVLEPMYFGWREGVNIVYDGANHSISNIYMDKSVNEEPWIGAVIFCDVNELILSNITFQSCKFHFLEFYGAIAAGVWSIARLDNVHVKNSEFISFGERWSSESGDGTGYAGLLYNVNECEITNCSVNDSSFKSKESAGFVSHSYTTYIDKSYVNNCHFYGGTSENGGLVAFAYELTNITDCYVRNCTTGDGIWGWAGLVYAVYDELNIDRCYVAGVIDGLYGEDEGFFTGGFITDTGTNDAVRISNSFVLLERISGLDHPGIVHYSDPYFDGERGIVIDNCFSLDSLPLPKQGTIPIIQETALLKSTYTAYAGWDFDNVWIIDEGNDYPKLIQKGTIKCVAFLI